MKTKNWLTALAWALAALTHAQGMTLGVSEGTSGGLDHAQGVAKYEGLTEALSRSLGQKVNLVFVREFARLEAGMKEGRFDFVLARPSDYPARGLRDYGYRFVATAQPDGHCLIIVPKDSPLKSLNDIKGKRLAMPEEVSYMSRFCRAELRDKGVVLANENVKYVREQGAVAFFLENKLADAGGIASYSGVARKWEKDGHRVLYKSAAQPYFPLIAGAAITPAQIATVQKSLLGFPNDEAGQKVLKTVGVQGFTTETEGRLRQLLTWLGN